MIKRAGDLSAFDVGSRLVFKTMGGHWGIGDPITVRGVIANIQFKKNGDVRIQISPKEEDGLRFGHNLVYSRYDDVTLD